MQRTSLFHRFTLTSIGVLCAVLTVPEPGRSLPQAMGQPQRISLNFNPPNRGAPPATAGGATRGYCLQRQVNLVPVLPEKQVGLTLAARPSFFVYIPQVPVDTAELLLLSNEDTEVLYQRKFKIPATPGIVRFDLPTDAPALAVGKQYHWFVSLLCNPTSPSANPTSNGWVERIETSPDLSKALATAKPGDLPTVFAKAGIWHETLTSLADLRRSAPQNSKLTQDWTSLLRSAGLEPLIAIPIVNTTVN